MVDKDNKNWQYDLETYIRQGEPEQSEKLVAWRKNISVFSSRVEGDT